MLRYHHSTLEEIAMKWKRNLRIEFSLSIYQPTVDVNNFRWLKFLNTGGSVVVIKYCYRSAD